MPSATDCAGAATDLAGLKRKRLGSGSSRLGDGAERGIVAVVTPSDADQNCREYSAPQNDQHHFERSSGVVPEEW